MKILVAMPKGHVRDTFIPNDTAEKINRLGDVEWNNSDKNYTPDELRDRLAGVTICFCGWGNACFDDTVLQNANDLKIIAYTGGSVANLVTNTAYQNSICVLSGNELYAESVAEGFIAYALSALRDIPKFNRCTQEQGWSPPNWYNEGLLDQTVGLIGFGAIARHVVKMLRPFRAQIKVYADHVTPDEAEQYGIIKASLEEVFTTCKIISIHCAQTPETHHMIDRSLLQKIPDGSLLINTARGSIIDEQALADELQTGRFKAVLDVYEVEPLPMDSKLRGLSNVILIPHMGGPTIDRRKVVTESLIFDIKNYMGNRPLKLQITAEMAMRMTR